MTLKEFIDYLQKLPAEIKDKEVDFIDISTDDIKELEYSTSGDTVMILGHGYV